MAYFLLTESLVSPEIIMLRSGSVGRQERADDAVQRSLAISPRTVCPQHATARRTPRIGRRPSSWVRP